MGAWGWGIFDDDTAYDFTDEITVDAKSFFEKSFHNAVTTDYLEYEDGHAVTVSAAYLDNWFNGTHYRTDTENVEDMSNVNLFGQLFDGPNLNGLRPLAINALKIVMGLHSELNELWSENKELYPHWKENLEKLIERLK